VSGGLGRFPQVLQETEHFWRWPQKQLAKIVQYGEPKFLSKVKEKWPLVFCEMVCDITFFSSLIQPLVSVIVKWVLVRQPPDREPAWMRRDYRNLKTLDAKKVKGAKRRSREVRIIHIN
jgi:hypothetical protein